MSQASRHIDICVCTYRRPVLPRRVLTELRHLETGDRFTFHIIVGDNDENQSTRDVVVAFQRKGGLTSDIVLSQPETLPSSVTE